RDDSWRPAHVSDYAASHPWEDWAETFAHYLHLSDTLETAYSYGLSLTGPRALEATSPSAVPSMTSTPQPRYFEFQALLNSWLSL
ncbi:putative zinc-binding metallopeptidase, partial [Staphylococcus aureus]